MKTSTVLCALVAMLPAVRANFDVYFSASGGFFGGVSQGYAITPADDDISCEELGEVKVHESKDDVSGGKHGIRCSGGGCGYDPGDVNEMEIHTNDHHHYTIYKNRDMGLFMKTDEKVGDCKVYMDLEHRCEVGGGVAGRHSSFSKVRCEKTHLIASDFD